MYRWCLIALAACGYSSPRPTVLAQLGGQSLLAHTPQGLFGALNDGFIWRYDDRGLTYVFQAETGIADLVASGEDVYYTLPSQEGALFRLGGGLEATGVLLGSLRADEANLYWLDRTQGLLMRKARFASAQSLASAGAADAPEVAVDATHVYWYDSFAPGVLKRVPKSGGITQTLANGVNATQLQVQGGLVLWLQAGAIFSLRKGGGAPREVVQGPSRFWAYADEVFYTIYDSRFGDEQALWRMRPDGAERTSLVFDLGTLSQLSLVRTGETLFYTDGDRLVSLRIR